MKSVLASAALATCLAIGSAAAETTEWDVSLWGERRPLTEHVHRLAELLDEKTDGDFTLRINYGGLSKDTENLDGLRLGAFEMAQFCAGYHPDKTPSLTVLELPFLDVQTLEEELAVSEAVYAHPSAQADLERWGARILLPSPTPQHGIAGRGDPPRSLEDFEGLRIGMTGGLGRTLQAIGALPVPITASQTHAALEDGVISAVALAPHAHLAFRSLDLGDWWTANLPLGTVNCPVAVSTAALEVLPEKHHEALDGAIEEALAHYLSSYEEFMVQWESLLEENAVQQVTLSSTDVGRLLEMAAPIRTQWIADMSAKGLPGEELHRLLQDTLQDVRARRPATAKH
ncbi:TRAP transporter substrate-binding protein DctP [Roseitranquillus sediminis]|uniref:TRAP transporter substrate-binding protein DctP n=1 Tax=Roseitranquillus sediminis TaxID=2809051 RepID=UPI001D0C24F0|nr:TRAP transporter substrate-binding protein DctP [Roseitranquillus sediminis]MBM9595710.1 TRAP transporter substrate-binding protein DctP [Roseitranquillus sediminis]